MNPRVIRFVLLLLLGGLVVACSSAPSDRDSGAPSARFNLATDPYWQDPRWDNTLLNAVQSAIHDPADPTDTSTPGLHAMVKFTYLGGTIEYPEIVQGTGDTEKDKLLLHELAAVTPPQASGVDSDQPHEFILDVDMPTPYEMFRSSLYPAIDYAKVYSKEAIIEGAAGINTVDFEYQDGKTSGITLVHASGFKSLDKASIQAVTRAVMPSPPSAYAGKPLHMEVVFCYTLQDQGITKNVCPTATNVIIVHGWRLRRF